MESLRTKSREADLFERLREASGCAYQSDLKSGWRRAAVRAALAEVPADAYPCDEWRRLAAYFECAGARPPSDDSAALRQAVMERLK